MASSPFGTYSKKTPYDAKMAQKAGFKPSAMYDKKKAQKASIMLGSKFGLNSQMMEKKFDSTTKFGAKKMVLIFSEDHLSEIQ